MTYYKNIINFLFVFSCLIIPSIFAIDTYKGGNDFLVYIDNLDKSVYNDNIKISYKFSVENLKSENQEFIINLEPKSGWTLDYKQNFILKANEKKEVVLNFIANSAFDYSSDVVSSDVIKISQRDDYTGYFQFPVEIIGNDNNKITLNFGVNILKKEVLPVEYISTISTEKLSPVSSLKYTIRADNLKEEQTVNVIVEIDNKQLSNFNEVFKKDNYYKIFSQEIPSNIKPENYKVKIIVKYSDSQGKSTIWEKSGNVEVVKYENLAVVEDFEKSLVKDTFKIDIVNNGNVKSTYEKKIEIGVLKYFFFGTNKKDYIQYVDDGVLFNIELEMGEEVKVEYYFNYLPIYIITIVLIILVIYIYYKKNSNPLDIETKLYEIQKVSHEGVKSLKVRIGFENIKENEIEDVKIIFRMPSYLNVKENSFLLSEPKKVLKGSSQYKMTWEFKRFEKNDSRILGFALINPRGVLGDIKLPDLEFELKIRGKIRKYYQSFPIIKG